MFEQVLGSTPTMQSSKAALGVEQVVELFQNQRYRKFKVGVSFNLHATTILTSVSPNQEESIGKVSGVASVAV